MSTMTITINGLKFPTKMHQYSQTESKQSQSCAHYKEAYYQTKEEWFKIKQLNCFRQSQKKRTKGKKADMILVLIVWNSRRGKSTMQDKDNDYFIFIKGNPLTDIIVYITYHQNV